MCATERPAPFLRFGWYLFAEKFPKIATLPSWHLRFWQSYTRSWLILYCIARYRAIILHSSLPCLYRYRYDYRLIVPLSLPLWLPCLYHSSLPYKLFTAGFTLIYKLWRCIYNSVILLRSGVLTHDVYFISQAVTLIFHQIPKFDHNTGWRYMYLT